MRIPRANLNKLFSTIDTLRARVLVGLVVSSFSLISGCGVGAPSQPSDPVPIERLPYEGPATTSQSVAESTVATSVTGRGCFMLSSLPVAGLLGVDSSNTPRADESAELLATEATGSTVADENTYQRVVAELQAIQSISPQGTDFTALPCNRPNGITVWLHNHTAATEKFERYNKQLKLKELPEAGRTGAITLQFDGVYNTNRLAAEYEALPNVAFAEPNYVRGDSNDICLEIVANDQHLYIFDAASGDCTSGCLEHEYRGFIADANGNVVSLGRYSPRAGDAEPEWFANAQQCRAFL